MARTDNLSNYLTDIADAIRVKKGASSPINASDFDDEILSIPGGGGTGLEYEMGTYIPSEDISRPTILFNDTHSEPPTIVVIVASENEYALSETNELGMWAIVDYSKIFNTFIHSTSDYYGFTSMTYERNSGVTSASGFIRYPGSDSGDTNYLYFRYHATETGFKPGQTSSTNATMMYEGYEYKWIAIWY